MNALINTFGPGGYGGARGDKRSLKTWWPGSRSADSDTVGDLPDLRGRSRDLERNSPIAAGIIGQPVTAIVGPGLSIKPQVDRKVLGLTDNAAAEWEERAALIWELACKTLDITRRNHFADLTALALTSELLSGDVLAVRRYKKGRGELLGTKIQLVEADRISTPQHILRTDPLFVDGVELDTDGAPVRYWVSNRHPLDTRSGQVPIAWTSVPAFSPNTGEPAALHLAHIRRPGQTRGVPYLANVIEPLKQAERLLDAELAAAVISSFFTVFVKTEGATGLADQVTDGSNTDDGVSGPKSRTHDFQLGPAAILDLDENESIEQANPMRPNAQFGPFFDAIVKQIGVATGIPVEVLLMAFTASYSASRASLLEAWRGFKTRRARLCRQWTHPIYSWVIEESVAFGLLSAPGFFEDPLRRHAWLGVAITGPSMGQINPRDETAAARERLDLTLTTRAEETSELTGGDWERKFPQVVKETEMLREHGLDREAVSERIATETTVTEENSDVPEKVDES